MPEPKVLSEIERPLGTAPHFERVVPNDGRSGDPRGDRSHGALGAPLFDGGGVGGGVVDLGDLLRAVDHLDDFLAAFGDGIRDDRVVRVRVAVRVVGVQGAGENAAVGERDANGPADERLNFMSGHGASSTRARTSDSSDERVRRGAKRTGLVADSRLPDWRLSLRAWQRDAFDAWMRQRPTDALIVATPEAGKTRFATRLAHALHRDRSVVRTLVVVPREHLKAQVAGAMAGAGIQLEHRFRNGDAGLPADLDGAVVTYQQVAAAPQRFAALARSPALVVLDEIHHAGEEASWGQALREAFGGARHRVALSGTPFRTDGAAIPFVPYHAGLSVADFAYDYAQALADGVCRALVFPLQGGDAEWVSRDGARMRADFEDVLDPRRASERLRTALTQETWLGDVLEKAHGKLLQARAAGHTDAGGLVAAMNQDHARFAAAVLERRTGVRAQVVVSDLDDASRRIRAFGRSHDPWIVAVHMISEGVDIPRLRVGVFASNVVSELYFRQFCGRFVRTGADPQGQREAYVYLPDDLRLRGMASRITADVRRVLRLKTERDEVAGALAAAQRAERAEDGGAYASIAARASDGSTLDFGPLFNPAGFAAVTDVGIVVPEAAHVDENERVVRMRSEERDDLRRELRTLVARASTAFGVDHARVHAKLNERFGGPLGTATVRELEARRRQLQVWLERRTFG